MGLPVDQRTVTVVRWYSVAPVGAIWPALERVLRSGKKSTTSSKVKSVRYEFESLPEGHKSVDELVQKRSRGDIETIILVNFENVIKATALDCAILSRYHPASKCTIPAVVKTADMSAGKLCSS
jgi:hypothetical protein